MTFLFCDWLHWVFPKNKNSLKNFLIEHGVKCVDIQPCDIGRCNRQLLNPTLINRKPQLYYRGFAIDNFIKLEILNRNQWYNTSVGTKIKYRQWVMYLIDWAFDVLQKEKPDYIVIEGGLTYLSRTLVEVARELNIKILALENSFIKDKIFMEWNTGYVCNRHSFARNSQDWINTRHLTKEQDKEVQQIIHSVFKNLSYPTEGLFDTSVLKYDKTVVIPLQVYSDQVILYDTKFNNEQFCDKIIQLANKEFKKWNVIFKCHPKEERNHFRYGTGAWLLKQNLPKNIHVIRSSNNAINTQSLLKMADLVLVNNSQAGLEACLLKKPVVVFGDAFYANKGFTIDYHEHLNWNKIKKEPLKYVNFQSVKRWFLYFYKWLYTKQLTDSDKQRIKKEINL